MSTHRLDVPKLHAAVERARGAGEPWEMSVREVARQIGVHPNMFTRLSRGQRPDADALISLLLWLNADTDIAQYACAALVPTR